MLAVRILVVRMCKEYNASGGRDVNGLQINNEQNSQVEKSSV